jgi:hypothetical protein
VHMIWPDFFFLRSCRSRRRSRASCSRGRRKHKTYLLGRRGLQRRCGLRLGRHGGLGKLVAVIHGTRNRCLVFGEAVAPFLLYADFVHISGHSSGHLCAFILKRLYISK